MNAPRPLKRNRKSISRPLAAAAALLCGLLALNAPLPVAAANAEIPIYFEVNSALLTDEARDALAAVAVRIKNREAEVVRIVGYDVNTDDNALAYARARAIRDGLVAGGVSSEIIVIDAETADRVDEAQPGAPLIVNRRGEILIRFE